MTPDKFREEVIAAYKEKIPEGLEQPSPRDLKDFFLSLWANGLSKEDTETLMKFFNPLNQHTDLESSIRGVELDRLEPLRNFLIDKTKKPREIIVKLAAILIDFQPRPYNTWKEIREAEAKKVTAKSPIAPTGPTILPPKDEKVQIQWKQLKKPLLYSFFIIAILIVSYQLGKSFNPQCMYWNGEHYVPISCRDTAVTEPKIALDKGMAANFCRIMKSDTLTKNSLGKVWYAKLSVDSIEFYTAPAFHPVFRDKKLKPMTEYILNKYVLGIVY